METDSQIVQWAEKWVEGSLSVSEKEAIEERLANDPAFATSFQDSVLFIQSLEERGRDLRFRTMLHDIQEEMDAPVEEEELKPLVRTIPLRKHYWRTAAVAAGVAALTGLTTLWMNRTDHKVSHSQYARLEREINAVKQSQNKLVANQNQIIKGLSPDQRPAMLPSNYSGTGFALTNDGYLVTNYHVAREADSIYIQTRSGAYYKATLIAIQPQADLALLKVKDEKFRFGKGEVPYTFATRKSGLGARIYTLGFPQDEVVYNEGYISARNGYSGDSMQYRLELPADPGQSGSPVLDALGNIVGIVTGKQTESAGITYAVSSPTLLQLLRSPLPDGLHLNLPKNNRMSRMSREQQVEKMQDYTCIVRVYRK